MRVSMCHCLDCQRRTGSAFGVQAWFSLDRIRLVTGDVRHYTRHADSGRKVVFSFCPNCGSTVSWRAEQRSDLIAVAVGAFADPAFAKPRHSVWERRQHPWTLAIGSEIVDRSD